MIMNYESRCIYSGFCFLGVLFSRNLEMKKALRIHNFLIAEELHGERLRNKTFIKKLIKALTMGLPRIVMESPQPKGEDL